MPKTIGGKMQRRLPQTVYTSQFSVRLSVPSQFSVRFVLLDILFAVALAVFIFIYAKLVAAAAVHRLHR